MKKIDLFTTKIIILFALFANLSANLSQAKAQSPSDISFVSAGEILSAAMQAECYVVFKEGNRVLFFSKFIHPSGRVFQQVYNAGPEYQYYSYLMEILKSRLGASTLTISEWSNTFRYGSARGLRFIDPAGLPATLPPTWWNAQIDKIGQILTAEAAGLKGAVADYAGAFRQTVANGARTIISMGAAALATAGAAVTTATGHVITLATATAPEWTLAIPIAEGVILIGEAGYIAYVNCWQIPGLQQQYLDLAQQMGQARISAELELYHYNKDVEAAQGGVLYGYTTRLEDMALPIIHTINPLNWPQYARDLYEEISIPEDIWPQFVREIYY